MLNLTLSKYKFEFIELNTDEKIESVYYNDIKPYNFASKIGFPYLLERVLDQFVEENIDKVCKQEGNDFDFLTDDIEINNLLNTFYKIVEKEGTFANGNYEEDYTYDLEKYLERDINLKYKKRNIPGYYECEENFFKESIYKEKYAYGSKGYLRKVLYHKFYSKIISLILGSEQCSNFSLRDYAFKQTEKWIKDNSKENIRDRSDYKDYTHSNNRELLNLKMFSPTQYHKLRDTLMEKLKEEREIDYITKVRIDSFYETDVFNIIKILYFNRNGFSYFKSYKESNIYNDGLNCLYKLIVNKYENDYDNPFSRDMLVIRDNIKFEDFNKLNFDSLYKYIKENYKSILNMRDYESYKTFVELSNKYLCSKLIDCLYDNDGNLEIVALDKKTNVVLKEEDLSSGERKILTIIKDISFMKPNEVLLLDEPELSLSVYWQGMLINDLIEKCKSKKIIIATQSPSMLNENYLNYIIQIKKEAKYE